MRRLYILYTFGFILLGLFQLQAQEVRVATFDVDATPPVGSMMAYDEVHHHNELTIRFRGVVITGAEKLPKKVADAFDEVQRAVLLVPPGITDRMLRQLPEKT